MSVELSQLWELVLGHRTYLTVGNLPRPVCARFRCDPGIVYLRKKEALHIFEGHKEMKAEDMMQLTFVVERGTYFKDPKRPGCMTSIHSEPIRPRPYMLGLKAVGSGEVWVSTFHFTNETKIRQRLSKWEVIHPGVQKIGGRPG